MSKSPNVLVLALACSTLLLTGALGHQPPPLARVAQPFFTAQSTPADASALLDEVLQRPVDWLSATVWQKMGDGENTFEATGSVVRAPGNRSRMELDVKSRRPVRVLVVSDGVTVQQSRTIGSDKPVVQAGPVRAEASAPPVEASADLVALLKRLRQGLQNPTVQRGLWQNVPVLRITGAWTPCGDTPAELRPALQPRTCHLFLDATTRWPIRIEWWGAAGPRDALSLLLQMEFRDLAVNQPLSAEECARLFSCSPPSN